MLALKDEAYKRGWLVVAHEHFEPIADPFKLKISKQLKWIRQTGTRIVVLNCYKKYSRQVRVIYNTRGSQSINLEPTVFFLFFSDGIMMKYEFVQRLTHSQLLSKNNVSNGKLSILILAWAGLLLGMKQSENPVEQLLLLSCFLVSCSTYTFKQQKNIFNKYILRIIMVTGVTMRLLSYTPGHHVGITNSYFGVEWVSLLMFVF